MKNNILLVDDEEDILEFLEYFFSFNGFQVYTSANGTEAIKLAKDIVPQYILLDIMMPKMDGYATCQELRKLSSLKNTIIAFLSAKGDLQSRINGLNAGADDFFQKPIKPLQILQKLKEIKTKRQ